MSSVLLIQRLSDTRFLSAPPPPLDPKIHLQVFLFLFWGVSENNPKKKKRCESEQMNKQHAELAGSDIPG